MVEAALVITAERGWSAESLYCKAERFDLCEPVHISKIRQFHRYLVVIEPQVTMMSALQNYLGTTGRSEVWAGHNALLIRSLS